jgi:hypothetical protein
LPAVFVGGLFRPPDRTRQLPAGATPMGEKTSQYPALATFRRASLRL